MTTVANKTKTDNSPTAAFAIPETVKSNLSGQSAFSAPIGAPSGNAAGAVQLKANPSAASFGQVVAQRSESGEMEEEEIQMKPVAGNFSQAVTQRSTATPSGKGAHTVSPMPLQLKKEDEKYDSDSYTNEQESNEESKQDENGNVARNMQAAPIPIAAGNAHEQESNEESKEDESGSVARNIQAAPVPIAAGNAQEQESTEESKEDDNGNAYAGNIAPLATNSGGNAEDIKNDGNLEEAEAESEERKELY